jgi:PTH1 family peptidyl-tRNA hydrolase
VGKEKVTLVLPETMMNASGKGVAPFVKSVKAAKMLVVVRDDLDLPTGTIKMVFARGSGGHKGVESIMRALKTDAFVQMKVGISPKTAKGVAKKPSGEEKVIKHVLGKFSPTDEAPLKKAVKTAVEALHLFITDGVEKAMMEANTK